VARPAGKACDAIEPGHKGRHPDGCRRGARLVDETLWYIVELAQMLE